MTCIMTFWIFLNINTNLDIRVKSSAVSVWDFIFVSEVIPQTSSPWLCVLVHPLLKSSSSTVFMELCFVVSVVSLLSQRPCKESHHGAAQPHCAPTTIPELTHLSSSNMSELQIYVRNPTGHEEDCVCLTLGLFSGSKKVVLVLWYNLSLYRAFVINLLKVNSDRFGSDWSTESITQ